MKFVSRVFTPTRNRRLNELAGFLLFASAAVLFLALLSYSPLDPSLNTASSLGSRAPHNWIGLFGAMISDLMLQSVGLCVFLLPVALALLGARWFKSRAASGGPGEALQQIERRDAARPHIPEGLGGRGHPHTGAVPSFGAGNGL